MSGYHLTTPRYGALREGEAVLIFVTETFTAGQRVKSDGGHPDEFPVFKLNDVRHFDTGIYDYDLMTSVFVPVVGGPTLPTKITFGSQEWCGNVFDQLVVDGGSYRRTRHSYFDGEGDVDEKGTIEPGVLADALPIAVRGLIGGDLVAPGGTLAVRVLPTLADVRLTHGVLAWTDGTLTRDAQTRTITVPAGAFEVSTIALTVGDVVTSWDIEVAYPHRIVGWRRSDGEVAVLTGSIRSKYWEHNDPAGAALRTGLGLAPTPSR